MEHKTCWHVGKGRDGAKKPTGTAVTSNTHVSMTCHVATCPDMQRH